MGVWGRQGEAGTAAVATPLRPLWGRERRGSAGGTHVDALAVGEAEGGPFQLRQRPAQKILRAGAGQGAYGVQRRVHCAGVGRLHTAHVAAKQPLHGQGAGSAAPGVKALEAAAGHEAAHGGLENHCGGAGASVAL